MDSRVEIKMQHQLTTWPLSEGQQHSPLHSWTSISEEHNYRRNARVVEITLGTQLQKECMGSRNKITVNSVSPFWFPDEGRTSYIDAF